LLAQARRRYRALRRVREVVRVLAHHGFGQVVEGLGLGGRLSFKRRRAPVARHTLPMRMRMALEDLGPSAVKFGQLLSTRPDVLPPEFILELRRLQDRVGPFPFEHVREVIGRELGAPVESLFSSFDEEPFAAASIAQVHRARLADGTRVVVKVKRPGVERVIKDDLELLREAVPLVERYLPAAAVYNPRAIVEEFARTISAELDFRMEGRHAERLRADFALDETVCVPQVFWDLSCESVLTVEEISGVKIDDLTAIGERGWSSEELARVVLDCYLKQIFEHGFFHGDPHPGNLFALGPRRIAFVDFGIVGRLDSEMLASVGAIFVALARRDADALEEECERLGTVPDWLDRRALRLELLDLLDRYWGARIEDIQPERLVHEVSAVAGHHGVRLPRDFVLLGKTVLGIGSVARALDPSLDLVGFAKPYARALMRRRLSPRRFGIGGLRGAEDLARLLRVLPRHTEVLLDKLRQGELKLAFEHRGLDALVRDIDRSSNRISFSLVIAALIVGSSIIMQLPQPVRVAGVPVGVVGYLLAGVLGLWLAYGIIRSGRL